MAKTSGGIRGGGSAKSSRRTGPGASFGGTRTGNIRMKSRNEVNAQIARIQSYTHNTGVSPQRFFRAVGRVSSAVESGRRMNPMAPNGRYQTNEYILRRKRR